MKTALLLIALLSACRLSAAIVLVQHPAPASAGSTTTSLSESFVSLPSVGNTVHAFCSGTLTNETLSMADNHANSYTVVTGGSTQVSGVVATIVGSYAHVATSTGTFTVTCTSTSADFLTILILEYSGEPATPVVDGTNKAVGSSGTAWSPGSITTTAAGDLILGACGSSAGTLTLTPASGFTIESSQLNGNSFAVGAVEDQIGAAGTYTPSITSSVSAPWACGAMAFKASGGVTASSRAIPILQ